MKCKICGNEQDPSHWTNENEMREHQMCFTCNFWRTMLEKDAKRPSHTWCMIDGTHYVIEPDDPKSYFKGFGGREFHIRFKDGHEVTTHNLWCQGEPEGYWREQFPDNAQFENNLKWKQIGNNQYLVNEK